MEDKNSSLINLQYEFEVLFKKLKQFKEEKYKDDDDILEYTLNKYSIPINFIKEQLFILLDNFNKEKNEIIINEYKGKFIKKENYEKINNMELNLIPTSYDENIITLTNDIISKSKNNNLTFEEFDLFRKAYNDSIFEEFKLKYSINDNICENIIYNLMKLLNDEK